MALWHTWPSAHPTAARPQVLSWCPKNTPLRKVLGALKDTSQPVDLRVYPTEVRGEEVWANFTQ